MTQGHVIRNRVTYSETSTSHRVRSSEHSSRKPLTCANTQQGREGQVIRKVLSRTRVTRAGREVLEHPTLPTLPAPQQVPA